jgi:multidrug efflux pump
MLTLFTTPVIYLGFDSLARRFRGDKAQQPSQPHGPQAAALLSPAPGAGNKPEGGAP